MEYEKAITSITVEWLVWDVLVSVNLQCSTLPESTSCLQLASYWPPPYPTHLPPSLPLLLTVSSLGERERERESEAAGTKRQSYWNLTILERPLDPGWGCWGIMKTNSSWFPPICKRASHLHFWSNCAKFFLNVKCRWRYPYGNALCNCKYTHIKPLRFHACLST